ncbi:MAG: sorbosone dehydrogenase family protein [Pyrinomonadaceae bacterium MAG19_C2-C3]|nr:sorbosone dehydrogenase family protein [Pyrinomonadaceae bacterium MAG19_C2-C3]
MTTLVTCAGLMFALIIGVACAGAGTDSLAGQTQDTSKMMTSPVVGKLLTGEAAKGDWTTDAPGVRRKLTPADLPKPYATDSARNQPRIVRQPEGAMPNVPAGFKVEKFAVDLSKPRMIRTAPNGDVFVAESDANRVRVLRDKDGDGKAETSEVFASDLRQPFGIAFYPAGDNPKYVYVANTDSVVRFPYQSGDLKARGASEMIVANISGGGRLEGGGHWTRDIVFSKDGGKMYVSVGSRSNVSDDEGEARRARIFEYTPDGKNERVYAWGIRNPVGIAIHPATGDLWTSVNERDGLGDHLVPDYITRVQDGGFYGWSWYYIGANQDPRHIGKRPDLKDKVIVPDVLLQSHTASLGMEFYTGKQFPAEYQMQAFAAQHGSWNRERRTGYKVIYAPVQNGRATGEYVDFMTGFVTPNGGVWGRPVAVATGKDGSMFVSDDGGDVVWRVSYRK